MPKTIQGDPLRRMILKMFEKGKRHLTDPTTHSSPMEQEARSAGYESAGHEFMEFLTTEWATQLISFVLPNEHADPEDYIKWMLEDALQTPVTIIHRDSPRYTYRRICKRGRYITIVSKGQYVRPKVYQDQPYATCSRLRLKL